MIEREAYALRSLWFSAHRAQAVFRLQEAIVEVLDRATIPLHRDHIERGVLLISFRHRMSQIRASGAS